MWIYKKNFTEKTGKKTWGKTYLSNVNKQTQVYEKKIQMKAKKQLQRIFL